MKLRRLTYVTALGLALLALAACETRSISDSGYHAGPGGYARHNPFYKGELSELDVIGVDHSQKITDADIQKAFETKQPMALRKGSSILLVQSGAMFPDEGMVKALEKYYTVAVFSGVPEQTRSNGGPDVSPYVMTLRLAAAKGGYEKIVAYWGILESAREGLGTKAVSWVPIIGGAVPDENQRMRIRLKVAVIDVKSGQWEMFVPDSLDDESLSAHYSREASDQTQVALLKTKAYQLASEDLVKRYAR